MIPRTRARQALFEAVAAGLLLAGAVATVLGTRHKSLSPAQLAIQVGELRSSAAEAALVAEQLDAGRLNPRFTRTHVDLLLKDVRDGTKSLDEAQPQQGLEGFLERAKTRGDDVRQLIEALSNQVNGRDSSQLDSIRDDLRAAADALHELEQALTM
jgi:hypothetical protein